MTSATGMAATSTGGLLFDIDGTLAETDPLHIRAFNQVMARWGIHFDATAYNATVIGRTNAAIFADLLPHEPLAVHRAMADEKEATFRDLAARGIAPAPGLVELLDWAGRAGVPYACVTNAPRPNAELILAGIGLAHRFEVVVIADELAHGKPHPLPYLTGAARIGVDPARCVAFEDSRSGILAAVAAGATTVGMTTSLDEKALVEAGATLAVRDFTDSRLVALIGRTLHRQHG